jgi:hypothetical protein
MINTWSKFLDTIDSSGGHLALLTGLILLGMGSYLLSIPKAEDIMMGAFGALLMALKGTTSNKEQQTMDTTVEINKKVAPSGTGTGGING